MGTYQRCHCLYRGSRGVVGVKGQVGSIRGGTEATPLGILTNKEEYAPLWLVGESGGVQQGVEVWRGKDGLLEVKCWCVL